MRGERLRQTLRLYTILTSTKRTKYLKEKGIFGAIGENCNVMSRTVPLYARLIKLGNNVRLASKVTFITHDVAHVMLNDHPGLKGERFKEKIGCIEIQDNVFVGAGTTILYGVRIGSNVIIGAGSLINRDIPSNSVVVGVPARIIYKIDEKSGENTNDPDKGTLGIKGPLIGLSINIPGDKVNNKYACSIMIDLKKFGLGADLEEAEESEN